jgi:hypothetical protein
VTIQSHIVVVARPAVKLRAPAAFVAPAEPWCRAAPVNPSNPFFTRTTLANRGPDTVLDGYTLVRAENLEEAVKPAEQCPVLPAGGGVEVGEHTLLNAGRQPAW